MGTGWLSISGYLGLGVSRWLPCVAQWEATREVWTLAKVLGESQEVIEVRTGNSTHK